MGTRIVSALDECDKFSLTIFIQLKCCCKVVILSTAAHLGAGACALTPPFFFWGGGSKIRFPAAHFVH